MGVSTQGRSTGGFVATGAGTARAATNRTAKNRTAKNRTAATRTAVDSLSPPLSPPPSRPSTYLRRSQSSEQQEESPFPALSSDLLVSLSNSPGLQRRPSTAPSDQSKRQQQQKQKQQQQQQRPGSGPGFGSNPSGSNPSSPVLSSSPSPPPSPPPPPSFPPLLLWLSTRTSPLGEYQITHPTESLSDLRKHLTANLTRTRAHGWREGFKFEHRDGVGIGRGQEGGIFLRDFLEKQGGGVVVRWLGGGRRCEGRRSEGSRKQEKKKGSKSRRPTKRPTTVEGNMFGSGFSTDLLLPSVVDRSGSSYGQSPDTTGARWLPPPPSERKRPPPPTTRQLKPKYQ